MKMKLAYIPHSFDTIHSREDPKCLQHPTFLEQEMEHQGNEDPGFGVWFQAIFQSISSGFHRLF